MKFAHLSDLHIGKRINGFNMEEDQRHILAQILNIIQKNNTDAVVIAGDVYDKSSPSAEAVSLFDAFLCALSVLDIPVMIISGNHDCAVRLGFASRIMARKNIYICTEYTGKMEKVSVKDADFYMLPFIKPVHVRDFFDSKSIESYDGAVRAVVENEELDKGRKNIMVAHQFVTGAALCESETVSVGGSDNIGADIFDGFDYVALGHIHGPQSILRDTVRYCGSPLKYSFSEEGHKKSLTIVDTADMSIEKIPLVPLHDMRKIKGTMSALLSDEAVNGADKNDYIHAVLTDEEEIIDAVGKLRSVYPNIMRLEYDNTRTRSYMGEYEGTVNENKSPFELFASFYESTNGTRLDEERENIVREIFGGDKL